MNSMELNTLATAAERRRNMEQDFKKKQEELEVTGVSRSGRVRKKSSKLMDFESPDEIEPRFRRPQQTSLKQHYPGTRSHPQHDYNDNGHGHGAGEDGGSGSDSDVYDHHAELPESMESDSSQSDENSRPARREQTPAHHSLYMTEKNKRKTSGSGRNSRSRPRRKPESTRGKARVTAYMLWARGTRAELLKKNPEMDFSAISKRLGELWSTVNFSERRMWKLKAQRLAVQEEKEKQTNSSKIISNAAPPRQHSTPASRPPPVRSQPKQQASPTTPPSHHQSSGVYRVTGCGAAEIGAHLRLLGESLAIIGERLKEHEGQIAVSGSVSVLLDTLLCSLAPLLCVTRALPVIAPDVEILQDTLDNIAYIMPGL